MLVNVRGVLPPLFLCPNLSRRSVSFEDVPAKSIRTIRMTHLRIDFYSGTHDPDMKKYMGKHLAVSYKCFIFIFESKHKEMETLNFDLVKTAEYKLKPFGRFYFKWKKGKEIPHLIYIGELTIKHNTRMPLTDEQEKTLLKAMKKNKTDVFTVDDGYYQRYYTRVGKDLTEIYHKKFDQYKNDEVFKNLIDNR